MSGMSSYGKITSRTAAGRPVGLALLAALVAAIAVAGVIGRASAPGGARVAGPDVSTTTASQQYAAWYTRPTTRGGSTTAGEQYRAWYVRGQTARPGSTTAGRQYTDWFTRPADLAGSTSASEQYASWYSNGSAGR